MNSFQKHFLVPLKILFFKKSIYKKYIKNKFEIEIAFLEGPITRIFSIKNLNSKKIAWIHNDISSVFGKGIKAKIKRKIDESIYKKYEKLVFVSQDNLKRFEETYPDIKSSKQVIYNYIDSKNIIEKAKYASKEKFNNEVINFVTVARLVKQKGIDRLIRVHKRLIKEGVKHQFYIIGDGPEKERLKKLISENQISDTFHLLGKKENPYPYIRNADYFCLLSKFEGYGMVLEEAKILQKPIIITNTAAREAVEKYEMAKILENSQEGIYRGLKEVILKRNEKKEKKIKIVGYDNSDIIEKIRELVGK